MTANNVKPQADPRPLRYAAEALRQIVATVLDFGLNDAARMLERARLDIEEVLPRRPGDTGS